MQTIDPSGTLNTTGETEGVSMINGAGTLTVDATFNDIFTNNSLGGAVVDSTLVAVSTTAANTDQIVFNSSSEVFGTLGTAGLFFLKVDVNDAATTVNYYGTVFTTTMDVGSGTVNFKSGTNTNLGAVAFTGDGTVSLAANTQNTGALTTGTDNTGTLTLASGSRWTGAVGGGAADLKAVNVIGGSDTAGVSASIVGAVQAYSFSLGTNTLNIDGALDIDNPGPNSITTTFASPTVYGHIVPTGATSLPATLGVAVLVPATSYIPVGTQFNVVAATSGTNGSVVSVTAVNPTNPLYTFQSVPLAGTLNGLVTIEVTGIPLTTSTQPAAQALQAMPQSDLLAPINALTDAVSVSNAVAQLNPSASSLAAPSETFQQTQQFQNLWLSRLDMCSLAGRSPGVSSGPSGVSSGDDMEGIAEGAGLWAKGFGYFGNQDAKGDIAAYDTTTYGGMIGFDKPLSENLRGGLGIGYSQSNIDGRTFDTGMDTDTYQATAYLGHERGPWFVRGSAAFGWNEYASERRIVFTGVNRTAEADYSGQQYTVFAITGRHFPIDKFTLTPFASLQYSRVNLSDYAETGAGDANLSVDSQGYDFVESGLGAKIERNITYRDGVYVPEIHFKWLHELANPTASQTATFTSGGAAFTTRGSNTTDDTFNIGAGVTLLPFACGSKTWSLELVYDYYWTADSFSAHQGTVRTTFRF